MLSNLRRLTGALVAATALAAHAASAAPIPVNTCGADLNIPGATYVLTQNLNCGSTSFGVKITAPNVVFDLNGYTIEDSKKLNSKGVWVRADGVTVKNGWVTNWFYGVYVDPGAEQACITGITARYNKVGIEVHGDGSRVIRNLTVDNSLYGIKLEADNSEVCYNRSSRNLLIGIWIDGSENHVVCNTVEGHKDYPQATGIVVQEQNNLIYQNTATANKLTGISLVPDFTKPTKYNRVLKNCASANKVNGISIVLGAKENLVERNFAIQNGIYDLADLNPNCDNNVWTANFFQTATPLSCID